MVVMDTVLSPQILTATNYATYFAPFIQSLYLATLFQKMLSTTAIFLTFQAYIICLTLIREGVYTSQVVAIQAYYTAAVVVSGLWMRGIRVAKLGWKATEPFRRKLFFEFMVFVLGGGYGLLLVVLWPGWLVVMLFALGAWFLRG